MFFQSKIKWWFPLATAALIALIALASQPDAAQTAEATEPVLVIDAGHGGADGGAVAADGTLESDINIDVALRLDALARFWGIEPVMTRTGSDIDYPADATSISAKKVADQHARVELINSTPGAVLISIHQNNYPAASPFGIQVFFGSAPGSDEFALLLQENMTAQLCPNNRRVASPVDDSIYLMNKIGCTAVLAECGFMSNPNDLENLKTGTYRLQLAAVMLASYLQYIRGLAI